MQSTRISVCIPTYNGAAYVAEALQSVFAQTYLPTELIVSDDGSSDGTLAIVDKLSEVSPIPIRVLNFASAGRLAANWNHCIDRARGEYVKFLFQDDRLHPRCIERLLTVALEDPRIGMVFGRRRILEQTGHIDHGAWTEQHGECHLHWARLERINPGTRLLRDSHLLDRPINKVGEPSSVLLSRRALTQVHGFREDLLQVVDIDLYLRLFRQYRVGFVDEIVSDFRLHDQQATVRNRRSGVHAKEFTALMSLLLSRQFFWLLSPRVRVKLLLDHHWSGKPYRRYLRYRRQSQRVV